MNILIVCQYFWPEEFRVNDLALELSRRGHAVTVLTGKPNYPKGDYYTGYSFWGYKKEKYGDINIIRVPIISRGKGRGFRLILNYLSYIFFACIYVLFNNNKCKCTMTFGLSPILQAFPAILHRFLYKSKSFLWVQDLWPESVSAAGGLNNNLALWLLRLIVRCIYKRMDQIFVQSEAFIESIVELGGANDKIHYIPNWAEDLYLDKSLINPQKYLNILPKGFKVLFAGNVGEAQDFESIIQAAIFTRKYNDIKWVIIGDGRKKSDLEEYIVQNNLKETVCLLGRYPVNEMPHFFANADVMLLSLKDEPIFALTIPSKLQSYMAFGKPIVSMMNGIGLKVVKDSQSGLVAKAGDYKSLADNIIKIYLLEEKERVEMGNKGKEYYKNNFDKIQVVDKIEYFFMTS